MLKIWYKRCPQKLSDCEFHENSHNEISAFPGSLEVCFKWLAHNTLGHLMKVGMGK
jgi:hypothetical protein